MIQILKRNEDQTFEIISPDEVVIGDEFQKAFNSITKEVVYHKISGIIEQRKSKGTFNDESKRPFWAKVS